MNTLKKIEDKKNKFSKLRQKYNEEIGELQWEYIQEKYDLTKDCICEINKVHYLLVSIKSFGKNLKYLSFSKILRNGNASRMKQEFEVKEAIKIYETLEDYTKTLEPLESFRDEIY